MNGVILAKFLSIHISCCWILLSIDFSYRYIGEILKSFSEQFGHLPIQLAAHFGTRKDVEILFEVTSSRIPAVHDWSVDGIISYIKSEPKLEVWARTRLSYYNIFTYVQFS
jgi:hypothetical protein